MSPGKTDEENLRFLCFMANTLKAVYDNNGLLKATVLNATNAHRLGANEAPPAIISSFLGKQVSEAFDQPTRTVTTPSGAARPVSVNVVFCCSTMLLL